jgi:phosphohistidine phosphatase SixA
VGGRSAAVIACAGPQRLETTLQRRTVPSRLVLAAACLALAFGLAAPGRAGAPTAQALHPKLSAADLVVALRQGGYVLLMRHGATEHVAPDPETFDIADCSTQRNLSEAGRAQARRMGEALRKLGIPISKVLASPYCRCLETGRLVFGKVEPLALLSTWDDLTVPQKSERAGEVRALLAQVPPAGTNEVLITHTGTLLYSFGLDWRPEGVVHVFQRDAAGGAGYVGKVDPDEWAALAGLPPPAP